MRQYWILSRFPRVPVMAFSPDGTILAIGGQHVIWLKDVPSGETIAKKSINDRGGPDECVTAISFRPDGEMLAVGQADGVLRLFEVKSGKEKQVRGGGRAVYALAFDPKSKSLVYAAGAANVKGGASEIVMVDATTGEYKWGYDMKTAPSSSIAFAPDGESFVSNSPLESRDAASGKVNKQLKFGEVVNASATAVAFSPDGKVLLSREHNDVYLYDTKTWKASHLLDKSERYRLFGGEFGPGGTITFSTQQLLGFNSKGDTLIIAGGNDSIFFVERDKVK